MTGDTLLMDFLDSQKKPKAFVLNEPEGFPSNLSVRIWWKSIKSISDFRLLLLSENVCIKMGKEEKLFFFFFRKIFGEIRATWEWPASPILISI